MATRSLPSATNTELADAPLHSILVEKRCLGQTELKVKPGQVGTTNATQPKNLGKLDYAHLRVPLPKNLSGSGIFQRGGAERKFPDAYFLMRRSSDGFVSATGMFKAAFPWASQDEEATEKEYIKTLPAASTEEVAGNIWIHPEQAITLAEEYSITPWIMALLDPEEISRGTKETAIRSPPAFKSSQELTNGSSKSPTEKKKSTRGRAAAARAESPTATSKAAARKIATPRKRKGRANKNDDDASVAGESVNGDAAAAAKPETVKVEVETTTGADGEEDVETTKVNIEMPANSPLLELPQDTESLLETAREMVAEAEKLAGGPSLGKGKRKAKEQLVKGASEDEEPVPAKKAKVEIELKKEKIKRRAITGIAASLAVGALIPSMMALLPWA